MQLCKPMIWLFITYNTLKVGYAASVKLFRDARTSEIGVQLDYVITPLNLIDAPNCVILFMLESNDHDRGM